MPRKQKVTAKDFLTQAANYLKKHYGLELNDIDLTEEKANEAIAQNETPVEYIDWYAEKYNLTSIEDVNFGKPLH